MIRRLLNKLKPPQTFNVPQYGDRVPELSQACFRNGGLGDWYPPVLIHPHAIGIRASQIESLKSVMEVLNKLEIDDYIRYLQAFYEAGLSRFGHQWIYADIATVLLAATQLISPQRYLEIGVRRGRSMAMVASVCPDCDMVGFDIWQEGYAGIPNPGPDFVKRELEKIGHRGTLQLISGNSHETVPGYLRDHPDQYFDLITVDGDHSLTGAAQDLVDILPRLKRGGVVVFDDISSPHHPYLIDVWKQLVRDDMRFSTWEFPELGYGVALAVRKW